MSRLVGKLLAERGDASHDKLMALKYMMFIDTLRERGPEGEALADWITAELTPLENLGVVDLVRHGTPFFWFNVHRFFGAGPWEREDLAAACRHLLMTAFDAFFAFLPDGAAFHLSPVPGSDVLLPSLGVRLAATAEPAVLRRRSARALSIETGGRVYDVDLDRVEPELALPRLAIPGHPGTHLLCVRDVSLFHTNFLDKLAPDTPAAAGLARMIGESLDMIRLALPELGDKLTSLIRWYVPLSTPSLQTHNSFSAPQLIGVIFLSEAYNDVRLAEAMVHEYHHNELYKLMDVEPIVEYRADELFYSPWRPDPRPLYGLFHALHVFSGVVDFLAHASERPELQQHTAQFLERRRQTVHQLRMGVAQVDRGRLSPLGQEILRSIEDEVREEEERLGLVEPQIPPALLKHLHSWSERNPELVSRVRMP